METPFESILLSFNKPEMISYLDNHPKGFEEAVLLAVSDRQPFSWRAAWLLYSFMEENDSRIQEYTELIINSLEGKIDGHQRELLKVLSKMELNEDQEGFLFDFCVKMWKDIYKQSSVRSTALRIFVETAKKYPELSQEVMLLTQEQYLSTLSPGIKKSVQRILRDLNL